MDPLANTQDKAPVATTVTETEIKDPVDPLAILKLAIKGCIRFPDEAETTCEEAWEDVTCAWDKNQTILELTHLAKQNWSQATAFWAPEDDRTFNADWVVLSWIFRKQDHKGTEPPAWAMRANAILMKNVPGRTVAQTIQEILAVLAEKDANLAEKDANLSKEDANLSKEDANLAEKDV